MKCSGPGRGLGQGQGGGWRVDVCGLLSVWGKSAQQCSQWSEILEKADGILGVFSETLFCLKKAHSYHSGKASIIKIKHQIADLFHVITES